MGVTSSLKGSGRFLRGVERERKGFEYLIWPLTNVLLGGNLGINKVLMIRHEPLALSMHYLTCFVFLRL